MPAMLLIAAAWLRRLAAARGANALMITAFALIPLTFSVGMAIDYSRASRLQTKLNAVADAASLAATTTPMLKKPLAAACDMARRTFAEGASGLYGLEMNTAAAADLTITVTEKCAATGDTVTTCPTTSSAAAAASTTLPVHRKTTVTYAARSINAFGRILEKAALEIGGTSVAEAGGDVFYQIVFVVDISSSMGIGGTADDIAKLRKDKQIDCAFACHDSDGTKTYDVSSYCNGNPDDYFCHANGPLYCPYSGGCGKNLNTSVYADKRKLARRYGYKLKIDFVNEAIGDFLAQLKPVMAKTPDHYLVSIDTLGTKSAQLRSPTSDYAVLEAAAKTVDVEVAGPRPLPYNHGWTHLTDGLAGSMARATNVGDGSTPAKRKTFFILLSDGVQDVPGNIMNGRKTDLAYVAKCNEIKDAGVTIYSIDTGYPAVPEDSQYTRLIVNLPKSDIPVAMRNCASSPSRYFEANDGPAIRKAAEQVFTAIVAESSRLTR